MKISSNYSDNDGEEEFDLMMTESDLSSILNDPDLNRELMSLSGSSDYQYPTAGKISTMKKQPTNDTVSHKQIDISSLVDIDIIDSAVEVTEEDMNDPELNRELLSLSNANLDEPKISDSVSNLIEVEDIYQSENKPSVLGSTNFNIENTKNEDVNNNLSADEAKSLALKYKREGNTAEALRWYRYAKLKDSSSFKTINNTQQPPPSKPNTKPPKALVKSVNVPPPVKLEKQQPSDAFSELEEALEEAIRNSLIEAKKYEKTDKAMAVVKMKEYKSYQQDLLVLKSRRNAGIGRAPLFQWETIKTEKIIQHLNIPEDQLLLTIIGVSCMDNLLSSYGSKPSLTIRCSLNLSSKEEDSFQTSIPLSLPSKPPPYPYPSPSSSPPLETDNVFALLTVLVPGLKRGRSAHQLSLVRKKATFELLLQKGGGWLFAASQVVIATVSVSLADLATKCRISQTEFPWMSPDGGKRGKAVGGSLLVSLTVRSPLGGPEKVVEEARRLIVAEWPSTHDGYCTTSTSNTTSNTTSTSTSNNTSFCAPPPSKESPISLLSETDKAAPSSVDLLESNDVLEHEIEVVADKLSSAQLDEDEEFSLTTRRQLLQAKLHLLVYKVQNEVLSLQEYIDLLRKTLLRDQQLLQFLRQHGRAAEAAEVARRVDIMQAEISGALEG